jgi:3-oxoadipate enol-lactonase
MDDTGTEDHVDVEDVRLFFRLNGRPDAPVLLLSNSLGTDVAMWAPQVSEFGQYLRVLRYDSRGHGRSGAPPGPYTLDRLGHDALALLDHLGIERAHVCGLSLGGVIAQWLAIYHSQRVARVVLADTAARIGTDSMWNERIAAIRAGGMRAIREAVIGRFLTEPFREHHPDVTKRLGETLEATPVQGYIAACEALRDADLRPVAGSIQASTLVVVGALDVATPPEQAYELHSMIAGSALVEIPRAAHLANVEQPDVFNERVLAFLRAA